MEFLNNISTIQTLQPNMLKPMQQLPTLQKLPTIKSITPTPKSVGVTSMPEDTKEYWYSSSDPTQVNSLLDVISNTLDPVDNHGDITNAFSDNMLEWWRRHFSKPIEYRDWGMFFNNTLRGFGEDVDVLANPVKALLPVKWTTAKETDRYSTAGQRFKKAIGFGVKGRTNYDMDFNTGSKAIDTVANFVGEFFADPLNIIELGAGTLVKNAAKKGLSTAGLEASEMFATSSSVLSKDLLSKVDLAKLYRNTDITEAWLKGDLDEFQSKFYNYFISQLDEATTAKYILSNPKGYDTVTNLGTAIYRKAGNVVTHKIDVDAIRSLYKFNNVVESVDKGILIVAGTPIFPAVHVMKKLHKMGIVDNGITKYVTANVLRNANEFMSSGKFGRVDFKLDSYEQAFESANKTLNEILITNKIPVKQVEIYKEILPEKYAESMRNHFVEIGNTIKKICTGEISVDEGNTFLKEYLSENLLDKTVVDGLLEPKALSEYWKNQVTKNPVLANYLDLTSMQAAIDTWQKVLDDEKLINGIILARNTFTDALDSLKTIKEVEGNDIFDLFKRNKDILNMINDFEQGDGFDPLEFVKSIYIRFTTPTVGKRIKLNQQNVGDIDKQFFMLKDSLNDLATQLQKLVHKTDEDLRIYLIEDAVDVVNDVMTSLLSFRNNIVKIVNNKTLPIDTEKLINLFKKYSANVIELEDYLKNINEVFNSISSKYNIRKTLAGTLSSDETVTRKSFEVLSTLLNSNLAKRVNYKELFEDINIQNLQTIFSQLQTEIDGSTIFDNYPNIQALLSGEFSEEVLNNVDDLLDELSAISYDLKEYSRFFEDNSIDLERLIRDARFELMHAKDKYVSLVNDNQTTVSFILESFRRRKTVLKSEFAKTLEELGNSNQITGINDLEYVKNIVNKYSDDISFSAVTDSFNTLTEYGKSITIENALAFRASQLLTEPHVYNAFMETLMRYDKNPADMLASEIYTKQFIDSMNLNLYNRTRKKSLSLDNVVRVKFRSNPDKLKEILMQNYDISDSSAAELSRRILEFGHIDSGSDVYATELAMYLEHETLYNSLIKKQNKLKKSYIVYDIETYDPESLGDSVNAKYGSVHQITVKKFGFGKPITFTTDDPSELIQLYRERGVKELPNIIQCTDERDLLYAFDTYLAKQNPLGVIGYNTHSFDQEFLRQRYEILKKLDDNTYDNNLLSTYNYLISSNANNTDALEYIKDFNGIPYVKANTANKIASILEDRAKYYEDGHRFLRISEMSEATKNFSDALTNYLNTIDVTESIPRADLEVLNAFSKKLSDLMADVRSDINMLSDITGDGSSYVLPNYFKEIEEAYKVYDADPSKIANLRYASSFKNNGDPLSVLALKKYYDEAFSKDPNFLKNHPEIKGFDTFIKWATDNGNRPINTLQDLLNIGNTEQLINFRYVYNKRNIDRFFDIPIGLALPKKAAQRLTDVAKAMGDRLDRLMRDPKNLFKYEDASHITKYFRNADDLRTVTDAIVRAIKNAYPEHWVNYINFDKIYKSSAETFALFWQLISEHGSGIYEDVPNLVRGVLNFFPAFNDTLETLKYSGSESMLNLFDYKLNIDFKGKPLTLEEYINATPDSRRLLLSTDAYALSKTSFEQMRYNLESYMFRSNPAKTLSRLNNTVSFGADVFSNDIWKTVKASERLSRFDAVLNTIPNANADMILRRSLLTRLSGLANKVSKMSPAVRRRYVTLMNNIYAKSTDIVKLQYIEGFCKDINQLVSFMLFNNAPFVNFNKTKYAINNITESGYLTLLNKLRDDFKLNKNKYKLEYGLELIEDNYHMQIRFAKGSGIPKISYDSENALYRIGTHDFSKDTFNKYSMPALEPTGHTDVFLNDINSDISTINEMLARISDEQVFLGSSKIVSDETFDNIKMSYGDMYSDKSWYSISELKEMGLINRPKYASYDLSMDAYTSVGYHNFGSSLEDVSKTYRNIINCKDAKDLSVAFFFDTKTGVDLNSTKGSFFYGLSDKEIVDVLNSDEAPIVVVLVSDNSKQGYHMESVNILNTADLQKARLANAKIVPYQVYSRLFSVINNNAEAMSGGLVDNKFIKSVLFAYKVGFLTSPGTWIRNIIDSNLKAVIDTKDFNGMVKNTWKADKLLREYDNTINIMKDAQLKSGSRLTDTDINDFFTNAAYAKLREKCNLTKDEFYFINGFVKYGPSSGETRSLSDWMKRDLESTGTFNRTTYDKIVDLGNKTLMPMNYIESRVRFAQYLTLLDKGVTYTEAFRRISHTAFDYSIKSRATHFIENIIPFYNFQKLNILYWFEELSKNPRYARMLDDYIGDVMDSYDLDPYELSQNQGASYYAYNGDPIIDGTTGMVLKLNPSYMDFVNFMLNPGNKVMDSMLAPIQAVANSAEGALMSGVGIQNDTDAAAYAETVLRNLVNPQYLPLVGPIIQRTFIGSKDNPDTKTNEDSTARKNYKRLSAKPVEAIIGAALPGLFGSTVRWEKYKQNTKYYNTHGYYNSNSFRTYTRPARNYNYYTPNRRYPGYRIKHSRAYWYAIRVMNAPARYRYQVTYY